MIYTSIKKIKDPTERKRIIDKLIDLREQLDKEIPAKTAANTATRKVPTEILKSILK